MEIVRAVKGDEGEEGQEEDDEGLHFSSFVNLQRGSRSGAHTHSGAIWVSLGSWGWAVILQPFGRDATQRLPVRGGSIDAHQFQEHEPKHR